MGKTGTTTLQDTLAAHRGRLAQVGVLYPTSTFSQSSENHNGIIGPFMSSDHTIPREFIQKDLDEPGTVARAGRELWADIQAQARSLNPAVVILSGEYLFTQPEDVLVDLRDLLTAYVDDIQIVAYVRDPAAFYLSLVQQQVRASYLITPPDRFEYPIRPCLTRHSRVFGDRLSVKAFDRSKLRDRCIVRDFLDSFVPEAADVAAEMAVADANESMSAEAMCIMQRVRRHGWPDSNDIFNPDSTVIMRALASTATTVPQTPARLPADLRAAIARRFARDLAWLHERFGLVFEEFSEDAGAPAEESERWTSNELTKILDVDSESVDRVTVALMKSLSEAFRAWRRAARGYEVRAQRTLRRRATRRLAGFVPFRGRTAGERRQNGHEPALPTNDPVASRRI
jgi:hypothetical protein